MNGNKLEVTDNNKIRIAVELSIGHFVVAVFGIILYATVMLLIGHCL